MYDELLVTDTTNVSTESTCSISFSLSCIVPMEGEVGRIRRASVNSCTLPCVLSL